MRSKLDEQLNILNKTMIEMGALCEQSLKRINDNLSNHWIIIDSELNFLFMLKL